MLEEKVGILSLQKGLFIENRRLLLPWGARFIHLRNETHPDSITRQNEWSEFNWYDAVLFDGLTAPLLQVVLFPYGWFDSASVILRQGDCLEGAVAACQHAQNHLAKLMRRPPTTPNTPVCPSVVQMHGWEQRDIFLGLVVTRTQVGHLSRYDCLLHVRRKSCCALPASNIDKRAGWQA